MKKGDKIVGIVILVLIAGTTIGTYLYKQAQQGGNADAVVVQEENVLETIDLSTVNQSREWVVTSKDGRGKNTIRVENGRIRFVDANCPDQVCVHAGWLGQPGEIAVCIPNKLFIRIEGTGDEVDGFSY